MTDQLRNSLSNCAKDDLEIGVNSRSDFLHEEVSSLLPLILLGWVLLLLWKWASLVVVLYCLGLILILLWDNRGALKFVSFIIRENVILLCINDGFNNLSCVVTLLLKDLANDVHYLWAN